MLFYSPLKVKICIIQVCMVHVQECLHAYLVCQWTTLWSEFLPPTLTAGAGD